MCSSDFADALFERSLQGDRDRAAGLQHEALQIADELGLHELTERIRNRAEPLTA